MHLILKSARITLKGVEENYPFPENTVIYEKKHIFSLHPVPGTELLKPLDFPVMRAIKLFVNLAVASGQC